MATWQILRLLEDSAPWLLGFAIVYFLLRSVGRTVASDFRIMIQNRRLRKVGMPDDERLRLIAGAVERDLGQAIHDRPAPRSLTSMSPGASVQGS